MRNIAEFVEGTADPAYGVDGLGIIVAWNQAAAETFGLQPEEAIGKNCFDIICGKDEDSVCARDCIVRELAKTDKKVPGFDLRARTVKGEQWFAVTVVVVYVSNNGRLPYTIHIFRNIDLYKRIDSLLRDYVLSETRNSRSGAINIVPGNGSLSRQPNLTKRELEILKLVAKSETSQTIAEKLNISPITVDNHMQNVLKKLNAHSRLEAVIRAGHVGIL